MNISEWWSKLSPSAQEALREDPRRPLSAELVVAITGAAGVGPAFTAWEGQSPGPAHLTEQDAAWIDEHAPESS